ncbi:hypothetical protein Ferp_2185 [Ferroglobus placidus DSM 10642]|uniref:Uncharacterized protein n=1 Tax=Ferroglobus placidus (strain DSM 10642 / AEDII12DO) TaxID=589924 RepID=D3S0S3_FERPA|nr:hypothetical protein Ferp_2185 [Ferroglobus placidus DSM 10642]
MFKRIFEKLVYYFVMIYVVIAFLTGRMKMFK